MMMFHTFCMFVWQTLCYSGIGSLYPHYKTNQYEYRLTP